MKSKEDLQTMYNLCKDLDKPLAAEVIQNELLTDIRGLLVSINQKLCQKKSKQQKM